MKLLMGKIYVSGRRLIMKVCSIYRITNTVNGKIYFGQTWKEPKKRFDRHCKESGCPKIHRAILKYGAENFVVETVFSTLTQEGADYAEIWLIDKYDTIVNGYNLMVGGFGSKHSEETKQKIADGHRGKKRSPEACENIRLGKLGSKNPMFGKHHSEEHRRKQSEATKGKPNKTAFKKGHTNTGKGEKHCQAKLTDIKVIEIKRLLRETDMSEREIALLFNVSRSSIAGISQGKRWKHII